MKNETITTNDLLNTALKSLKNTIQDIIKDKDSRIEELENKLENELEDLIDPLIQDNEKYVILNKKHYKIFDNLNIPLLEILMYLPYEKLKDIVDKKAVSEQYKNY